MSLPNRREWPQCHKENSWQVRLNNPCEKEKKQSYLLKSPDRGMGKSQGGKGGQAKRIFLEEVEESMSG